MSYKKVGLWHPVGEINPNYKHGMKGTRFYRIWKEIKTRCYNEKRLCYKDYGGRGIIVCDEWRDSFSTFFEDMYKSYCEHCLEFGERNTTIDRIDNNSNYSIENCRWATRTEQMTNSRRARFLTDGKSVKTLSEWARYIGISKTVLWRKIKCCESNLIDIKI